MDDGAECSTAQQGATVVCADFDTTFNFPNEFHLPTNDALIQLGEDGDRKD